MAEKLTKFEFIWLDGKINSGEGHDVADAFRRLGYGGGAIRALDYYRKAYLYQVVPGSYPDLLTLEELKAKHTVTGDNRNNVNREELQGQPILAGLIGPMWGGYHTDGTPIIRYETQAVYNLLSD